MFFFNCILIILCLGDDGCESSDFSGFTSGNVAVIARGTCDFSTKVDNAVAAGAPGVLIYNYEGEGSKFTHNLF